jgi:hypothetical protein
MGGRLLTAKEFGRMSGTMLANGTSSTFAAIRMPRAGSNASPFRLHTYGDLESIALGTRREYRDGILATIAREDEAARFRDERTCRSHQARH